MTGTSSSAGFTHRKLSGQVFVTCPDTFLRDASHNPLSWENVLAIRSSDVVSPCKDSLAESKTCLCQCGSAPTRCVRWTGGPVAVGRSQQAGVRRGRLAPGRPDGTDVRCGAASASGSTVDRVRWCKMDENPCPRTPSAVRCLRAGRLHRETVGKYGSWLPRRGWTKLHCAHRIQRSGWSCALDAAGCARHE